MSNFFNTVITIAARDTTKLLRDRARIAANLIFPVLFIGVLGTSLSSSFSDQIPYNFLTFVFTGVLGQTMFQSTASGILYLIEDKQTNFAQVLFVAPISRYALILGKIIGETLVSSIQAFAIIIFAIILGIPVTFFQLLIILPTLILASIFGGAFGLIILSRISEQRSANQIFPFIIFPQYFLAGVFNPINGLPLPLAFLSKIMPMTYAVDLIRSAFYLHSPEKIFTTQNNLLVNLIITLIATLSLLVIGTTLYQRKLTDA